MRDVAGRRSAATIALLAMTAAATLGLPAGAIAHDPPGIDRFMYALGQVESGGRYDARNASSGAYGKYQIMPSNWPSWARIYLGDASARPTPANQEIVARGKIRDLHDWLDRWPVVAHWWLTGSSSRDRSAWSAYSRRYVDKVMAIYRNAADRSTASIVGTSPQGSSEASGQGSTQGASQSTTWTGTWAVARHSAYAGGSAVWSSTRGSRAVLTFTGRAVAWLGPVGPTRGQARIYLDGAYVRTVDLYAPGFRAVSTIFSRSWAKVGQHVLTIEVVGTARRPVVAVDRFRVG